jgi:hypothetical protein
LDDDRRGNKSGEALERLFREKPVADLKTLQRALDTTSRTTVFRALRRRGYLTSYSHAGRYYTLRAIPAFDSRGLWFYGEVRFSSHGTLRATIVIVVKRAPAGHTHEELEVILGLRVHDTLRSLVEAKEIGRERIDAVYVYVDTDPEHAAAQLARRQGAARAQPASVEPAPSRPPPPPPLDLARVVDVLLAVIHAPRDDARTIAARLRASGLAVEVEQVQAVFTQYGIEKKTARSRSRRSRRSGEA